MSVFRRKRKVKGRVVADAAYTVEFRGHDAVVHRWPLPITSVAVAREVERRLRALVESRIAGVEPDAALLRWLESTSPALVERIAEAGLVDARHVVAARSLAEHAEDWYASLLARHVAPATALLLRTRVLRIIDGAGWRVWRDISNDSLLTLLAARREESMSAQTAHHYHRAVLQFHGWMLASGRAVAPRLSTIRASGRKSGLDASGGGRVYVRRYESSRAFTALLRATVRGPSRRGATGWERALMYWFVGGCVGTRLEETIAIRAGWLLLDGDSPCLHLPPEITKNRRGAYQPIWDRRILPALRAHAARKLPGAQLFTLDADARLALRADLADAGIEVKTADGVYDFHSLRYQFGITLLRAGEPINLVQGLMRHSSIKLTMDRYARALASEVRSAGSSSAATAGAGAGAGPRLIEIPEELLGAPGARSETA